MYCRYQGNLIVGTHCIFLISVYFMQPTSTISEGNSPARWWVNYNFQHSHHSITITSYLCVLITWFSVMFYRIFIKFSYERRIISLTLLSYLRHRDDCFKMHIFLIIFDSLTESNTYPLASNDTGHYMCVPVPVLSLKHKKTYLI